MIELGAAAHVCCDTPGCKNRQPGTLVLMANGGFGAVPRSTAWQIALAPNGVFVVRCPEHIQLIQSVPAAAAESPAPVAP